MLASLIFPLRFVTYLINTELTGFFQAGGGELMMDSLSDTVLRGQAIQVHLEPLDRLETLMTQVHAWKDSAATLFLQKDSNLTLLEVKTAPVITFSGSTERTKLSFFTDDARLFCAGSVSKM